MPYAIVGKWHVRVDLTLDGGCFASMVYDDYTYLRLSFLPTQHLVTVMVGSRFWRTIEAGTKHVIAMRFDGKEPWTAEGTGAVLGNIHYLVFKITGSEFLDEMRASRTVRFASTNEAIGTFDVSDAGRAMEQLGECQAKVDRAVDPFAPR